MQTRTHPAIRETTLRAATDVLSALRVTRRRTMLQFALDEFVIADGRFKGMKFRVDRNPWAGVLLNAIDEGLATRRFNRFNTTGPSQQGKTVIGFVIPIMYHLFEVAETVLVACPSADIWGDKWQSDLLPALRASRYRDLLPTSGKGSKDATAPLRIDFKNGACIRVLTGGGDDKSRSAFTSRVLVVTETDGFDEVGGKSREADKLKQLEARTKSWDEDSVHYYECTVSIEEGKTWQMHTKGTESRLVQPCPHCGEYVTVERENLRGWRDAEDEMQAAERSAIYCPRPECSRPWSQAERLLSLARMKLAHRGQTVDREGNVLGPAPVTKTLSFRFNAAQSAFVKAETLGAEEWKAGRAVNVENEEKEMRQFRWALPHQPTREDLTKLDQFAIVHRIAKDAEGNPKADHARGIIPDDYGSPYVGIDVGKRLIHWTALAFRDDGSPHVVDYGVLTVPSEMMSVDEAVLQTLRTFRDDALSVGWRRGDELVVPDWTLVDSGWLTDVVEKFAAESGNGFMATKGFGEAQDRGGDVKRRGGRVILGPNEGARDYEVVEYLDGLRQCQVAADRWKSYLHARLSTPLDRPGAMTLYGPGDHLSYVRHLLAEVEYEEFDPKKGVLKKFRRISKQNHHLDSTALALVAAHLGGVRLAHERPEPAAEAEARHDDAPRRQNVQEIPQVY